MKVLILGPESRNRRVIAFLESRGCSVSLTTERVHLRWLQEEEIDYLVSFGYAPVLKPPVTVEYRHRILNIHPAFLPEGRGIYTNFWSFFEGRPKGVSIHFIDEGIDTGDTLARREVSFSDGQTLRTSHAILDRAVEELFFELWDDLVSGRIEAVPQADVSGRDHYRNRCESERLIELLPSGWDTPVETVEEMGADFFCGTGFWEGYEAEVARGDRSRQAED